MTRALYLKEIQQHWLALLLLIFLSSIGYAILAAANEARSLAGTPFEGLRLFIMLLVPLVAAAIGNRLVTSEYASRTQLFLEGLPLPRWRMPLAKFSLGITIVLLVTISALLGSLLISWRKELFLDGRLVWIMGLRAISYAVFFFSLFFLSGFLGRYRLALLLFLFLAFAFLEEHSQIKWSEFGPFALVDQTFPYEADLPPWQALSQTWGLTLLLASVAFLLALTREGSVASLLAQKMSHREKIFVAAALISVAWTGALVSEKTQRTPFDLIQAVAITNSPVVVKISADHETAKVQELGESLAGELQAVCQYLGRDTFPPLFITQRKDLDGNKYERGELEHSDGIFVQANILADDWDTKHFLAWLIRESLMVATNGRAELENRRWVLDGFPWFWLYRPGPDPALRDHPHLALRALYGTASTFGPVDTDKWFRFRERVGDDVASGVAWSMLWVLEKELGPERCREFLHAMLAIAPPKDARVLLGTQAKAADELLARATGTHETFLRNAWWRELSRARVTLAESLSQLPVVTGDLIFEPLSASSRKLVFTAKITPPPPEGTRYSFLHHQLPPFNEVVDPKAIRREQTLYGDTVTNEIPESFSRSARIYWTVSVHAPVIKGDVISGWVREEVP